MSVMRRRSSRGERRVVEGEKKMLPVAVTLVTERYLFSFDFGTYVSRGTKIDVL